MTTVERANPHIKEIKVIGEMILIEIEANHAQSMDILARNGLRPLAYQEALAHSPEFITELKGKWFYLDGHGIEREGVYTFNNKGELVELKGGESIDQKVRVWSGNQPLSFCFSPNTLAQFYSVRYYLDAYSWPDTVAPMVIGVKQDGLIRASDVKKLQDLVRDANELRAAK